MKGRIEMDENLLFNATELLQYKYITVPKELFINPRYSTLSSDSKLLYGFILGYNKKILVNIFLCVV